MFPQSRANGPTIFPYFGYVDANAALEWLADAFGFVKTLAVPAPDGALLHAEMNVGAGAIMLGTEVDKQQVERQSARSEIWHILRPLIETPFNGGPATWMEDIELEINRYGYAEESHFTIAYSPVPDETVPHGIGGVLATVHEITEKVVGERRIVVLRDLSSRAVEAKTAEDASKVAAATLAKHAKDVPFALLYLIDKNAQQLRLAGAAGVESGIDISPAVISLKSSERRLWPVDSPVLEETTTVVQDLKRLFGSAVPKGPWSDPPAQAVITPIRSNVTHDPAGVLIVGVSARLQLDQSYHSFIDLAASQIATAIANARAYEEERKRAEALAEIDRAKTEFFSNVSHEFRTPLTLMLGPLQDLLADQKLPATTHEQLLLAHRNSQRLLKLVNTLLDFSRIESGRIQAIYELTELSRTTTELASLFRGTVERAGLKFIVNCSSLSNLVYVDREMWEKIVLNLISNAFKFTFEGSIEIQMQQSDGMVHLSVGDTGTGIPADELPHLFERFHRVRGARGSSYEGSGIGLALVHELVKLHGGNVRVQTEVDRGSTFTVSIPLGKAHLPPDRIGAHRQLSSTGLRGTAYVEEALRWLRPVENDDYSTYPVVNDEGGFVGIVTETRLRRTAAEGGMDQTVGEIAQPAAQVEPEHTLVRAVVRMEKSGVRQLAVIDGKDGNRLIGLLTMSDIVRAHAHAALEAGDPDKSVAPESSASSDP